MITRIVLLSGHVSSGKTTLCDSLVERFQAFGLEALKTKEVLKELSPTLEPERGAMQTFGESLDRKTKGSWVARKIGERFRDSSEDVVVIVDAVRILAQIERVREAYGTRVIHIHLQAPVEVRAGRYAKKARSGFREFRSYNEVLENKTERLVGGLQATADIVIDTARCTKQDVVVRAASHLGFYGREYKRLVDVFVGGQYGSEGKGQIISYLAKEYSVLVRVGGPNAGHSVHEAPGKYVYHQLPSGTRSSDARLIIGPGAVINTDKLLQEISECQVDNERLSVDPQAMVISQADIDNERDLIANISSTGQGVGYATARRITDRGKNVVLAGDVKPLRHFIRDTCRELENAFYNGEKVLLEGTQGTGLSLYHGSYPHVTSRDTTVAGCLAETGISPSRVRRVVMVCRTYPIRVVDPSKGSTSGHMSQETSLKAISERSGIPLKELKKTERTSTTDRPRRIAEFDWVLLRKSASLNAPTDIALTFADYLTVRNRKARRLDQLSPETIRLIEEIEKITAAPVSLISTRFHTRSIIDRRAW